MICDVLVCVFCDLCVRQIQKVMRAFMSRQKYAALAAERFGNAKNALNDRRTAFDDADTLVTSHAEEDSTLASKDGAADGDDDDDTDIEEPFHGTCSVLTVLARSNVRLWGQFINGNEDAAAAVAGAASIVGGCDRKMDDRDGDKDEERWHHMRLWVEDLVSGLSSQTLTIHAGSHGIATGCDHVQSQRPSHIVTEYIRSRSPSTMSNALALTRSACTEFLDFVVPHLNLFLSREQKTIVVVRTRSHLQVEIKGGSGERWKHIFLSASMNVLTIHFGHRSHHLRQDSIRLHRNHAMKRKRMQTKEKANKIYADYQQETVYALLLSMYHCLNVDTKEKRNAWEQQRIFE